MTRHPSLLHINISHTKLDDNDVGIMINALKSSTVLIGLHLTGNQISRRMMNLMISHLNGKEVIGFKANSARDATNPMKKIENHSFRDNHSLKFNLKIRDSVGRALTSHRDNIFNVGNSTRDRDRYLGHNQTELILTRLLGQPDMKGASQ